MSDDLARSTRSGSTGPGRELAIQIGDLVLRDALFVSPQESVAGAARVMRQAKTSSALVHGDPLGILTSGDLRNRVLAEELPATTLVSAVMTRPVRTLPADAPLYSALLLMLDEGFEHVPITRDDGVVGVVTHMDMLRFQAHSPMLLLGRIRTIDGVAELSGYRDEIAATVRALLSDGVVATRISRVVATLNDALSGRLIKLAEQRIGPPPCPFAWLALGSEGRMEQVLLTDQDNALIYQDETPQATAYFTELADIVVDGLGHAGFAPCPGGYMATGWCHSLAWWESTFRHWVHLPDPDALLGAAIFFDYRHVHGGLSVQPLSNIVQEARHTPVFLTAMARTASKFAPPLGTFGRVRTENRFIDLKRGGLAAIVNMARLFGLEAGSPARATLDRLEAAGQAGVISGQAASELGDTFKFLIRLRLREQLRQMVAGNATDNRICYDDLTWLDQRRLRDAFRTVIEMQKATAIRLHSV